MSAGVFVDTKYGATYDVTQVHPIRVQPETLAATGEGGTDNGPPIGALTNPISAEITKSRRGLGLHPRMIYLKLTGAPPTGYAANSRAKIPALTGAFFAANNKKGSVVNYLGTTWTVTGTNAEKAS